MRAEIQMRRNLLCLVKKQRGSIEVVDLEGLFNDYRNSDKHEFTVSSKSGSPKFANIDLADNDAQVWLMLGDIACL